MSIFVYKVFESDEWKSVDSFIKLRIIAGVGDTHKKGENQNEKPD